MVFGGLAVAFYFISEPLGHWLGAMGIASTEYPWMVPTLTSVAILVASLLVALWAGIHGPRLAWTSLFATLISLAILWTAGGLVGLLLPAGQWAASGS